MRSWQKLTKASFAALTTGIVGQRVSSRSNVITSTHLLDDDDDADGSELAELHVARPPRECACDARDVPNPAR